MKIIAEVGSNWHDLDDCLHSIKLAREAGAHAVKFQLFQPCELYANVGINILAGASSPFLSHQWIPIMKNIAVNEEVEFMCTAFSSSRYKMINEWVSCHKIASAEITDVPILETVNSFKKPVYLSTGGASLEQIEFAVKALKNCPVTIMYCVTDYPARVVDFRHLEILKDHFGANYSYGYSDHSTDVLNIPMIAKWSGCSVIEKHVNFTDHKDTDDAPHSLNTKEFSLMTRKIMGEEISPKETFIPCSWQRVKTEHGYFRPR